MDLETYSYLPAMTEAEQRAQVASMLSRGLIPAVEHTERPSARNLYWNLWKLPLFAATSPDDVLAEVDACARANPAAYVKLVGYDPRTQGQVAFVIRRPAAAAAPTEAARTG